MDIRGRRILLTGASGGLGMATARELSRRGGRLILTARRKELLDDLAAETGAEVVVADLANRDDVDDLIELSTGVDVLVLNAGIGGDGPVEEITSDGVDAVIDVNLRAPIQMAVAFAQHKLEEGTPGQIVLVGSLSGLAATPNTRMYNATKFGLRGFALSFRQDLDDTDIGVTLVAPGFIRDAGMFADNDISLPSGVRTKSPQDVAAGVVKAIETNPAEVYVSPVELRLSATLSTIAPNISAAIQRRVGAKELTAGR